MRIALHLPARAACCLALAAASPVLAAESFQVIGVDPGDVLHIREQPDAEAPIAGAIPSDARQVRGFGCTSGTPSGRAWCRVKFGDVVGWVRQRYVKPEAP